MKNATSAPRTWSLQREWSRAFLVLLLALLIGAVVTITGVRSVLGQMEKAAGQLQREYAAVKVLNSALETHEQLGHQLLAGAPVDRQAFVLDQVSIEKLFEAATTAQSAGSDRVDALSKARQEWQSGLEKGGLWGQDSLGLPGISLAQAPAFAASGAKVRTHLEYVRSSSVDALDHGLVDTRDMEKLLTSARLGLLFVAIGAALYFRRRMVNDLVLPVDNLREGALRLQAGDFGHRVDVARRDELGEVALAFNDMAAALQDSHQTLTYRATHDSLTGLANRTGLTDRLAAWFERDPGSRPHSIGLLFIDIDDFKDVNDSLGHEGGDELLVQFAARLRSSVRKHDLVARLGGDEFAVVVLDEEDGAPATGSVIKRIYEAVSQPFQIGGEALSVTVSMGVAQRTGRTATISELLREADSAMYQAKHSGKARFVNFA